MKQSLHKILIVLALILFAGSAIYGLATGQDYFSNNNLRQLSTDIKGWGPLAPIVIIVGVFLPQIIPFFPIPTQFFEIAAGLLYGFWPAVVLVWISQVGTAIISFVFSEKVEHIFAKQLAKSSVLNFFHRFIKKHEALAIFVIRSTMSAPFNVSYLAGILEMRFLPFLLATSLGVISEVTIFVYIGTLISAHVNFDLWYVFIGIVAVAFIPAIIAVLYKVFGKNISH